MTDMGFGYYTGDGSEDPNGGQQAPQGQQGQEPKWFRDYMTKSAQENKELKDQLAALQQVNDRNTVADALAAKGYDRSAAALYTGDPTKVDDWLTTAGPLLAKQPPATAGAGAGQGPGGTPASTIPPDGQAQMQALQAAGTQNVAPPAGAEAEQVAQMSAMNSAEELTAFLAANGNQAAQYWNG
jgi:hypothetical protein